MTMAPKPKVSSDGQYWWLDLQSRVFVTVGCPWTVVVAVCFVFDPWIRGWSSNRHEVVDSAGKAQLRCHVDIGAWTYDSGHTLGGADIAEMVALVSWY